MNIVFAGVGGQGSVLATSVVASALRRSGRQVVTSEVHGMSQRGGTVTTAIRCDAGAPVVDAGDADILVAFERLEAIRHFPMVRQGGSAVVNDHRVSPLIESLKLVGYPEDIEAAARDAGLNLYLFPASVIAIQLGDARLSGVTLLGHLANLMDIPLEHWRAAIAETVPGRTIDANVAAFTAGEEWGVGPRSLAF